MGTTAVGIREFRASLTDYIDADAPVTITRHGQAVGVFVPLRRPDASDIERFHLAATKLQTLLQLDDQQVDDIVAEFDRIRRRKADRK